MVVTIRCFIHIKQQIEINSHDSTSKNPLEYQNNRLVKVYFKEQMKPSPKLP